MKERATPSWRAKLWRVGLSLGILTLLSSSDGRRPSEDLGTKNTPVVGQAERPEWLVMVISQAMNDLSEIYPELKKSGLSPREIDVLPSRIFNIPTVILNFTEYRINPTSTETIYYFFDSLGALPLPPSLLNGGVEMIILPRGETRRVMVVMPENAPRPSWARLQVATLYRRSDKLSFSYVSPTAAKDEFFAGDQANLTFSLAIEACQQTIRVGVRDGNGKFVEDRQAFQDAQELFCNSLGVAVAARLLGIPWEVYRDYASRSSVYLETGKRRPIILSRGPYESIPQDGSAVR